MHAAKQRVPNEALTGINPAYKVLSIAERVLEGEIAYREKRIDDADDFARFLLADFSFEGATVMVAPAPGFYATPGLGRNEVRIAYVLKREDLEKAVRVFAAGLEAYATARRSRPQAVS